MPDTLESLITKVVSIPNEEQDFRMHGGVSVLLRPSLRSSIFLRSLSRVFRAQDFKVFLFDPSLGENWGYWSIDLNSKESDEEYYFQGPNGLEKGDLVLFILTCQPKKLPWYRKMCRSIPSFKKNILYIPLHGMSRFNATSVNVPVDAIYENNYDVKMISGIKAGFVPRDTPPTLENLRWTNFFFRVTGPEKQVQSEVNHAISGWCGQHDIDYSSGLKIFEENRVTYTGRTETDSEVQEFAKQYNLNFQEAARILTLNTISRKVEKPC